MNILFIWEQGLGYGHLGQLFPLARFAKSQGHRVILAVRHMENVWAADNPFDLVVPAPNVRAVALGQESRTFSDVIRPAGFANSSAVAACTRSWLAMFDLLKVDAAVCDHAFNAVYAARAKGMPVARIGTGFTVPNATQPLQPLQVWKPHSQADCDVADAQLLAVLNEAATALNLTSFDSVNDLFGYGDEFVSSWPELDHLGPQAGRYYYGPMEGLSGAAIPRWPDGPSDAPKVFMYLPGDHPLEAQTLQAVAKLGWPMIFHSRSAPKVALAPNQYFSVEPVKTDVILGQADIFITHGSHGTCADALRAGCRQFLLPNSFERLVLSFQMTRAGLGAMPQKEVTSADDIVSALEATVQRMPSELNPAQERYARYDPKAALIEVGEDILTRFAS